MISEAVRSQGRWPEDGYRLADDVLYLRLDDGTGRLIDLAGDVFVLSETAAAMLTGVLGEGPDATAWNLAAHRGVPADDLRAEMEAFLAEVSGLVLAPSQRQHRRKRAVLIAPLLGACLARRTLAGRAWTLVTLAHLSTRLFGWAPTVKVWTEVVGRSAAPPREPTGRLSAVESAIKRAIAHHPLDVGCKERALSGYAMVRHAGLPARLVLGVYLLPFASHVWCESGGRVVADRYEDGCDLYTPLVVYEGQEC